MVDTSIIIDILRKTDKIQEILDKFRSKVLITNEISVMELYYGLSSNIYYDDKKEQLIKRQFEIEAILNLFQIFPFDRKAAIKTAEIMGILKKRGNIIDFRDGMIAGISLANGINKLATLNVKHFERIEDLKIVS